MQHYPSKAGAVGREAPYQLFAASAPLHNLPAKTLFSVEDSLLESFFNIIALARSLDRGGNGHIWALSLCKPSLCPPIPMSIVTHVETSSSQGAHHER